MAIVFIKYVELLTEVQNVVKLPTATFLNSPINGEKWKATVTVQVDDEGAFMKFHSVREGTSAEDAHESAAYEAVHALVMYHKLQVHDFNYDTLKKLEAKLTHTTWRNILTETQNQHMVHTVFQMTEDIGRLQNKVEELEAEKSEYYGQIEEMGKMISHLEVEKKSLFKHLDQMEKLDKEQKVVQCRLIEKLDACNDQLKVELAGLKQELQDLSS